MLLPAWAARWRRSDRAAHWWIAGGILLALASSVISSVLGRLDINNHFVWNWFAVPATACLLMGIAEFQVTDVERLATRLAIPLFAAAWLVVASWVETGDTFTPFLGPLHALTVLGAAAWAWVRRTTEETGEPIAGTDWFWILGGLAWYGAISAPIEPLALVLLEGQVDLLLQIWLVRNLLQPVSWLLVTWGILCHHPPNSSGSSSSPPPSP